ncbi:MAG TPA: RsmE family RNA methyltransferase [Candidatus Paceibacterota bacterium]|nr:RsmE family RNA methyltransferase [Candidatus Paceibacterota bacterium]
MNRFYLPTELDSGELTITDPRIVHQCKNVLRMEPGSMFSLFNGNSIEWHATIREFGKNTCTVSVEGQLERETESERAVHAGIAILKKENFELVAQKLVEMGIASITPLISHRTIKNNIDRERVQKIMIEAAEQAGRLYVPELTEPASVADFLERQKTVAVFQMNGIPVHEAKHASEITFMIGPEGGWSTEELELFSEKQLPHYSLGKTVLRAETAAIIGAHRLLWN